MKLRVAVFCGVTAAVSALGCFDFGSLGRCYGNDGDGCSASTVQDGGSTDAAEDALACTAADADAGPAFRAVNAVTASAANASSVSKTVHTGAGHLLVLGAVWYTTAPATVSDTLGNAWIATDVHGAPCRTPIQLRFWYALRAKDGDDTVTLAGVDAPGYEFFLVEYASAANVALFRSETGRIGAVPTNRLEASATGKRCPGDLVAGLFGWDQYLAFQPGAGFEAEGSWDNIAFLEDNLSAGASASAEDPTASLAAATSCWASSVIVFGDN